MDTLTVKFSYTADITSMNPPLTMTDSHLSPSLSELLPPALNPQGVGSETFITPPIDGTLVLPQIIDHHLTNTTEHPLFLFEESPGHLRKILWPEAARAVHRTAKLVISLLAPLLLSQADPTAEAPVISILASADTITYFSLIHGALRAGYRPFPISPRNSPAAVAHLLSKTNSKFVFVSHDAAMQDLYAASLKLHDDAASMHTFPMPKFEELYPQHDEAFEPLPLIQHPGLESLAMVLHSSGSTAFPKPIQITHRIMLQWSRFTVYGEVDMCGKVIAALALPMFHAMGVMLSSLPFTCGLIMSVFKPSFPPTIPTPESVISGVKATISDIVFCVPSFIEAWAANPDHVDTLKTLSHLIFGGAPLTKAVGDSLSAQGVPVMQVYGITEVGCVNVFLPKTMGEDWEYFRISKQITPVLAPQDDGSGAVELQVVASASHRPAHFNIEVDGKRGYATSDLIVPHPTKASLWRVFGRADDQIMLSTGEKTNPGPIESIILKDSHIAGVAMFGRGKFQNGILIEPKKEFQFDPRDEAKLVEFRNLIWPSIEAGNAFAPSHSRLFKEMIVIAGPHKPFSYTAKGTTRRPIVIAEYADEIEAAYIAVEESSQTHVDPPADWNVEGSTEFARRVVTQVLGHEVTDDDDIFQHGCDSLQATWMRNTILQVLRDAKMPARDIPQNFIYTSPTVASLGTYLNSICRPSGTGVDHREAKLKELEDTISRHTKSFATHVPRPHTGSSADSEVILITGTTGGLGSNILAQLVDMPSVTRVYALNRAAKKGTSLLERQRAALVDRGIEAQKVLDSDKVILLEGDTSLADLGLSDELYEEIRDSTTYIIHNAWRVDFNIALKTFEPLLRSVRNLIDLSLASPHPEPPRMLFASSIGIFRAWTSTDPAKEEPIADANVVIGSGYSESKWVAERIMQVAAEKTAFKPIVVRIGQLSGAANGSWNRSEWLPCIVKSGEVMGVLPDGEEGISWLPLQNAASAVIEFRHAPAHIQLMHLTHPRPVKWSTVFPHFSNAIGAKLIPYGDWLARLEASAQAPGVTEVEAARQNPALLLLDSFRAYDSGVAADIFAGRDAMGVVKMDSTHAVRVAPALSEMHLEPLGKKDVESWVNYWRETGFLAQQGLKRKSEEPEDGPPAKKVATLQLA